MSKQKLIKQLKKKNPKFNQSELEKIVDFFLNIISATLKKGKQVEIREFGKFYCKKLKENLSNAPCLKEWKKTLYV